MKLDSNKEKIASSETDITRYDLKDNLMEYNMESNVDFDSRLDAGRTVRAPYDTRRKTYSEHEDVKCEDWDSANCSQKKRDESDLVKDYNGRRFTERLKSSRRATSTSSNHVSERSNSGYKKRNGYRYSPPGKGRSHSRSHSRSRSDYETSASGSHRFQERSKKSHRDGKYDDRRDSKHDDYKNRKHDDYRDKYDDSRNKSDRSKRIYDLKESRGNSRRCGSGERDLRNKLKTSTSGDAEDRGGGGGSYRDKCESRSRMRSAKVAEVNAQQDNKRLDKSSEVAAAKMDSLASPGRTVARDTDETRHKAENSESGANKAANPLENITTTDENTNLEEGEILDSPEKNSNSANRISEDTTARTDSARIVSVEDEVRDPPQVTVVSVRETAISVESHNAITAEQVEEADNTKQDEAASSLARSSEDRAETTRQSSSPDAKDDAIFLHTQISDENNDDACKSHFDKDLNSDSTAHHVEIVASDQDRNNDDIGTNCTDDKSRSSASAKLADESEKTDDNTESVNETEKLDNPVKNSDKKENTNNLDDDDDDDCIHESDNKKATNCTAEIATTFPVALNCDNKDKNQAPVENDVCHREARKDESGKHTEMIRLCLRDHNYVQTPVTFDRPSVQQASVENSECDKATTAEAVKETKAETETVIAQSSVVKKTSLPTTKSKKEQQSKAVIISRRRRAVTLSDNNASMTVLKNTKVMAETAPVAKACGNSDSVSKPRACKASRAVK